MFTRYPASGQRRRTSDTDHQEKDLGSYSMDRSMRLRIGHYLQGRTTPYLG